MNNSIIYTASAPASATFDPKIEQFAVLNQYGFVCKPPQNSEDRIKFLFDNYDKAMDFITEYAKTNIGIYAVVKVTSIVESSYDVQVHG